MAGKRPLAPEFADILADINKDSKPSSVQYLREGDTTVKLVMPAGRTDIREFYHKFLATFKSEQFVYYLVAGVITEAEEDGVADSTRVRYIKVTKSIMLEILNLLGKRWKLFETNSPLIVITKGKKGGKVAYNVAGILETFNIDDHLGNGSNLAVTWPDEPIEDAAASQEESSAARDANTPVEGEVIK